jgi:glycerol-3-phosphate dehydrogenase
VETSFSYKTRSDSLATMGTQPVDLLVIGAGVTGAGIARDAAMRGIRTAIVDKGDFGSGASSHCSRLVHGGLRYLESGHLRWLLKANRERRTLLRIAPHLVWPRRFVSPVHEGGRVARARLAAGLWIYDVLGLFTGAERHRFLSKRGLRRIEPRIKSRGLTGGATYYDAHCDDARLTLATVRAAHRYGAMAANYVQVDRLEIADGQVRGARATDLVTGVPHTILAHVVVDATGAWSHTIRGQVGEQPPLAATKSVYIVVPRLRLGNHQAVAITSPVDGRVMFIVPWGDVSYVGPAESECETVPDGTYARSTDVVYLLRSVNALFPDARLAREDVLATRAAIEPRWTPGRSADPGPSPPEESVLESPSGLISVAGGTLTTHRIRAAGAVDVVTTRLHELDGRAISDPADTDVEPLPGGEARDLDLLIEETEREGVSSWTAEHLALSYGSETPAVLRLARTDPELADSIVPGHPAIRAELVHAIRREMALTLGDLLIRRTHVFYEAHDHAESQIPSIARIAGTEMEWDADRLNAERAAYANEIEMNLAFHRELDTLGH